MQLGGRRLRNTKPSTADRSDDEFPDSQSGFGVSDRSGFAIVRSAPFDSKDRLSCCVHAHEAVELGLRENRTQAI